MIMNTVIKMMVLSAIIVGVSTLTGCGHARTKLTDAQHRIAIDPTGLSARQYVRFQQALVASGKWIVVDRAMGMDAVMKEQNKEHVAQPERFADMQKYALWKEMMGIGAVAIGHADCFTKSGWLFKKNYNHCRLYGAIINTSTGEVMSTAEDEADTDSYEYRMAPEWNDLVSKLNDNFPKNFERNKDEQSLRDYQELAKEKAQRTKEELAKNPAAAGVQ